LYGIGVGPGDPDLLTLRAVKVLDRIDVVFAAASSKNDFSLALKAAKPHVRDGVEVIRLSFPMTKDQALLKSAWQGNAEQVLGVLRSGRSAAFLTLGDPLLYSTFGYLLLTLRSMAPEIRVEIVPGITSMQAAASRAEVILTLSGESLALVSGTDGEEALALHLEKSDTVVVLKAYKNFAALLKTVRPYLPEKDVLFASCLGSPDEILTSDIEHMPAEPNYLSLLIVSNKRRAEAPSPKLL
jgi:precorrin-2/cobalt-factor-2 C20-methyltransferase